MRIVRSSILAIGFMGLAACGGGSKSEATTPAANPCAEANPCATPAEGEANPCATPAEGEANPCAAPEGEAAPAEGGGW